MCLECMSKLDQKSKIGYKTVWKLGLPGEDSKYYGEFSSVEIVDGKATTKDRAQLSRCTYDPNLVGRWSAYIKPERLINPNEFSSKDVRSAGDLPLIGAHLCQLKVRLSVDLIQGYSLDREAVAGRRIKILKEM